MDKQPLILLGGGGHCKSVIDVIEAEDKFQIFGILDVKEKVGTTVSGYPIIGCDSELEQFLKECPNVIVTAGMIKSSGLRNKLFQMALNLGANLPIIISPLARVSKSAKIGKGSVVMHYCLVNANATVGENCILNNKSLVEHDAFVDSNCHISTNAVINGECKIGESVMIGSSSVIIQCVSIGDKAVIGAGAVVVKSVESNAIMVGNPAKRIN